MEFNDKKMTFVNLTETDKTNLVALARAIMYEGKADWANPYLVAWLTHFKFDQDQRLMVVSTLFPCRALDSVI